LSVLTVLAAATQVFIADQPSMAIFPLVLAAIFAWIAYQRRATRGPPSPPGLKQPTEPTHRWLALLVLFAPMFLAPCPPWAATASLGPLRGSSNYRNPTMLPKNQRIRLNA